MIRGLIDQSQVGQSLTGYLGDALAGDQRPQIQLLGHRARRAHHHAFENHPHVGVVHVAQNLADHPFEGNGNELDPVGGTVGLPQIPGDLLHTQLVGAPAQIEKAVMRVEPPFDGQIAGHRGIEATGYQRQHTVLTAQGKAAHSLMGLLHHMVVIAANLQAHLHIGAFQLDPGGGTGGHESGPDITLHVDGLEIVLAGTLHAHTEGSPRQAFAPDRTGTLEDIVEVDQRKALHPGEIGDTGGARQDRFHILLQMRHFRRQPDIELFPVALHLDARIEARHLPAQIIA